VSVSEQIQSVSVVASSDHTGDRHEDPRLYYYKLEDKGLHSGIDNN
jgi:hypothetical protein